MSPLLTWSLITGLLLILTIALVILGILKKRVNFVIAATVCFMAVVLSGVYTGILFAGRAMKQITEVLEPRSGYEAFVALFDTPADSSVHVMALQDPIVPKMDVALRMEVYLSPQEAKRIIERRKYMISYSNPFKLKTVSEDAKNWFKPYVLKGPVLVCQIFTSDDGDHQTLYFSADSTHLFVEDIAD